VPFAFYPVESPEGQQLLRDFSVDPAGLPALIRHDGSVLHNPSFADIAGAHGIEVQPADQVYDLAILGAGPAGLQLPCTEHLKGCILWSLSSWPSVVRPALAH
jgi:thioredoxin reductase (NADPH)